MSSDAKLGKRARSRAALTKAAFELFQEKGIQRTSLEEVAARAGMTKGAVYSSFRGKDDLVATVMENEGIEPKPVFRPGMTQAEIYRAIGQAVVEIMPTAHRYGALVAEFQLYAITHETLRPRLSAYYTAAFEQAMAAGAAMNAGGGAPSRTEVLTIQALILGLVHQRLLTPELVTDADIMAVFERMGGTA